MTDKDMKQVTNFYGEIRDILVDYQRQIQVGCDFGTMSIEIHDAVDWMEEKLRAAEKLISLTECCIRAGDREFILTCKDLCEEVANRQTSVLALIKRSYRYLATDPTTLIYSDLTRLQTRWSQLQQQVLLLDIKTANKSEVNKSPVESNCSTPLPQPCSRIPSVKDVELYFLTSPNHAIYPLFQKFPNASEKRISLDKNYVQGTQSLLKQKGRTKVPKLSRQYRIFIKSQLKNFKHRKENINWESDFGSTSTLTDSDISDTSTLDPHPNLFQSIENKTHDIDGILPASNDKANQNRNISCISLKASLSASQRNPTMSSFSSNSSTPPQVVPSCSPSPPGTSRLGTRSSPSHREQSPIVSKRRKMDFDDSPSLSPSGSPTPDVGGSLDLCFLAVNQTYDGDTTDTSNISSPVATPPEQRRKRQEFRGRLKKEDLWAAIESDYQYLMDEEIIETCKSTESDLSWESDDPSANSKLSYAEFMQQYKELTDWLNQIQTVTQRQSSSLSEKYLNQTYHEEMLKRTPRRKVFNDYAKQLMRRHSNMKEEISMRIQHLNTQWESLLQAVCPAQGYRDEETMLKDLEEDLNGLRRWLHVVEGTILPLSLNPEWTVEVLKEKLRDHQVLQRDIESHSKIVSAVLKLCERLQSDNRVCSNEGEKDSLQLVAFNLERRWHAIWLQSLEWQCRLEEAITRGKSLPAGHLPRERSARWNNYSFEDCSKLEEHAEESFDEKSDLTEEEGVDSDTGCFDTIPFSESEYEKIVDDAEVQTDDSFHGKVTPERTRDEGHGSMDTGLDSALGRSVSDDHIINKEILLANQARLSDQVTQAFEKKVVAGKVVRPMDVRPAQGVPGPMSPTQLQQRMIIRRETHDIGYSSESQSNEEVELLAGQATAAQASKMVTGSDGDQRETSNSSDDNVVVHRRDQKEQRGSGNNNQGSPLHNKWRHSMTSAYDTSSNCSELASHFDLDLTVDTTNDNTNNDTNDNPEIQEIVEAEVHQTVSRFISSPPDRHVYKLTTIETDSELSSAADAKPYYIQGEEVRSGADTDAESDQLSKSLELPFDDVPLRYSGGNPNIASSPKTPSNPRMKLEKLFSASDLHGNDSLEIVEEHDRSSESEGDYCVNDAADEGSHALFEMEEDRPNQNNRSNSELVQHADTDLNQTNAALTADQLNANTPAVADPAPSSCDSVRKLINQAEQLARDQDVGGAINRSQRYPSQSGSKKKHRKHKRTHDESFASTDGSALSPSGNSAPSSCDASSEGTSSESESEFSTASSDGEERAANSSVLLARSADLTLDGSPTVGTSTRGTGSLPSYYRKKSRDVPGSAGELYTTSQELDLQEFSISESAIHNLQSKQTSSPYGHKLRRTTSETSHLSARRYETPPRTRHKRRKLKRSASDEAKEGSITPRSKHSSSPPKSVFSSEESPATPGASSNTLTSVTQSDSRQHILRASSPKPISGKRGAKSSAVWNLSDLSSPELVRKRHADQVVPCGDTDDTDAVSRSMNSTVESFSENAWDNYQAAPYSCISSDPGEEKLDPGLLQGDWEHVQEFEEDFEYGQTYCIPGVRAAESKNSHPVSKEKRVMNARLPSNSYVSENSRNQEDSDSDLDDFHDVIEESKKAIHFTDSTLRKFRKDTLDTGIYIDPAEYVEPLATCQTNIKCLEVVLDTLQSEMGLENVGEEDINQIHDIINKWKSLGELAALRQRQSSQLSSMYRELTNLETSLAEVREELENNHFDNVSELHSSIKYLQARSMEWNKDHTTLTNLGSQVNAYTQVNPELQMDVLSDEVDKAQTGLDDIVHSCSDRLSHIQSSLLSWYDFNETQKELEFLMSQEREQLLSLEMVSQVVSFDQSDIEDGLNDLRMLTRSLTEYDGKMQSLRQSFSAVAPLCSDHAMMEMRADIATADAEMSGLKRSCEANVRVMEERLAQVQTVQAEAAASLRSQGENGRPACLSRSCQASGDGVPSAEPPSRWSRLWKLLKMSIPFQLALVLLFGMLALMDQERCGNYNIAGLVFSPQLRYVRGPPPT